VDCGGVVQEVRARRTTLSAGAIASPAILLRSGIGPADDLRAVGIEPRVDLPGVGANLLDHPNAGVILVPKPGVCDQNNPFIQIMVRYTAAGSSELNDMQFHVLNHSDLTLRSPHLLELVGASLVMSVSASLQRPSSIGRLRLASADPAVQPLIELNYFSAPEDMRRLLEGVRLCWQAANSDELAPFIERIALPDAETVSTDEGLSDYIRRVARTTFHPVGTAKMGRDGDEMAVVDQHCHVRGVEGLQVVDASIMPNIVRCNTNLTCIMIGERAADLMRAET